MANTQFSQDRGHSILVRNVIFGVEDSLVSTVGLLAGMATGNIETSKILAIGVIFLCVEGFSMAAGSYLSEHSTQEYETGEKVENNDPIRGAVTMFVSFIIAGFIPIAPYLFLPLHAGLITSVIVSLIFLGVLGYVLAKISHVSKIANVVRMVIVGGIAIVLGIVVGILFGVS